jgi:hypothetical protein
VRVALDGLSVTLTAAVNVTAALANAPGFALLVARTTTEPPDGAFCGAVYVVWLGFVCELRIVPEAAFPPTFPLTLQVTVASWAPVTVAPNAWVPPTDTFAVVGEIETVISGTMVTGVDAAFVESAAGDAVIRTVAGEGTNDGAVYTPVSEIIPQAAPEQPAPETDHDMDVLGLELAAGVSVAVKFAVEPAFAVTGPVRFSENELVMLTVATAFLAGSAMLPTMTVMFGLGGRTCGATYAPADFTVPHALPPHPFPETFHKTVRSGLPAEFTVAMNVCAAPSSTETVWGKTETETSLVIVTGAAADLEVSATLVACTVTELGAGKWSGAV